MKKIKVKRIVTGITLSLFTLFNISIQPQAAVTTNNENITPTASGINDTNLNRKIIGYFPEWAYKSEAQGYFDAADLQWESLTHIQYSFGMIDPATNKITLGDKHAAIEETFADHPLTHNGKAVTLDPTLPYKGHFNVLQTMKKQYPNVKLLMSVGGWAGSRGFYTMLDTDQGINTFADSCVEFVRKYNFDGIDIDFEYPSATSTSGNPDDQDLAEPRRGKLNERYNLLMKTLREKLDAAGKQDGKKYLETAAVTASSWVLGGMSDNSYAQYLDFLSVMSYDFHGGWNEFVENLASIYPDPADRETIQMAMPTLNMDWAYKYYRGVLPPEKIIMGIPYYTRGWENVQGGTNGLHGSSKTPATGIYNVWGDDVDNNGVLDPAGANPLWHVLNLMENDPNLKVYFDEVAGVPYVWQNEKKVFLSFENEKSIDKRVEYIKNKNLGGALIWVMNGDFGPNPNYKPGSTNINEGKYNFGDTLTSRLRSGLDAIGNCKVTDDSIPGLSQTDVEVVFGGKYDHPNYTYDIKVTNKTDKAIDKGWTVSFDLPKSAIFAQPQGGTATIEDIGDFNRVTITSSGWQNLGVGETASLAGSIKLCFGGVKNLTFNGMLPSNVPSNGNYAPTLKGISNTSINLGDSFNPLTGVTASDKEDGDLTSKISVSGSVNTSKAGDYTLKYTVTDSKGLATTKERIITVLRILEPGQQFYDSSKTYKYGDQVVYKDALYECISWYIPPTDDGSPANTKYWKLIRVLPDGSTPTENTAPVINGAVNKQIYIGDSFNPLTGVTASDKEDGDLTSKITVSGTVDTTKAGTYNLTYSVSDSKGLKATSSVVITVSEKTITNTAPVINGVSNKQINIGTSFNPLTGVTASDKEDGDLTSKIVVSGTVDTTKAGAYDLTYSVTDSKGLITTAKATITVVNDTTPEIPTYSPTKAYVAGDIVMYNGVKYKAKWWTQGETPGSNQWGAWEKIN